MFHQVYEDNPMSRTCIFKWHKRFKEKLKEVIDDSRSGRPLTSRTLVNIERVTQLVCGDLWLVIRMIASRLHMKRDDVWKIITEDLGTSEK